MLCAAFSLGRSAGEPKGGPPSLYRRCTALMPHCPANHPLVSPFTFKNSPTLDAGQGDFKLRFSKVAVDGWRGLSEGPLKGERSATRQSIGENEVNAVDARELHAFLGSKQQFPHWTTNRINQYEFAQGVDFVRINNFITSPPSIDYALSLDMAKELSMVDRNL